MEELNNIFASNLNLLRKKSGLTQKELGQKLDYSEKTIAKWESGTTMPSVEALWKLANFLHTDITSLLTEPQEVYFLGIDAGASKTRFRLCDEKGKMVKEIIGEACNSFDMGMTRAQEVLERGICEVCRNVPYSSVVMYAGIAGGGAESAKEQYREFFKKFEFSAYENGTDNENIISAGLDGDDGITLIMGTGVCLYKVKGNEHTRITGWGYLFDECGSAFNFGQDALKAYFAALDGYGEQTRLSAAIESKAGCGNSHLLTKLYDGGKKYIASFAPLVFECAEKYGDSVASQIIEHNMEFIAKLISNVSKDFIDEMEKVPVVIAGGLTIQPRLTEYIYKLLDEPEKINLRILEKEPVEGAVKKAQQLYQIRKGAGMC